MLALCAGTTEQSSQAHPLTPTLGMPVQEMRQQAIVSPSTLRCTTCTRATPRSPAFVGR